MVFVPVSFVCAAENGFACSREGGEGVVANLTVFLMRFASYKEICVTYRVEKI